jgi:hypothetical protein
VQFDPTNGSWTGRINPAMRGPNFVMIIAVVAPPTAQDLFRYFQKVGAKMQPLKPPDGVSFEPLDHVPAECKEHRHSTTQKTIITDTCAFSEP